MLVFFVEGGGLEKMIENPAISGNLGISQSYDKPFWEISAERKERERERKKSWAEQSHIRDFL